MAACSARTVWSSGRLATPSPACSGRKGTCTKPHPGLTAPGRHAAACTAVVADVGSRRTAQLARQPGVPDGLYHRPHRQGGEQRVLPARHTGLVLGHPAGVVRLFGLPAGSARRPPASPHCGRPPADAENHIRVQLAGGVQHHLPGPGRTPPAPAPGVSTKGPIRSGRAPPPPKRG